MITREKLDRLSKEQLVELCLVLADTAGDKMKALEGYKKQVGAMVSYMNEEVIVSKKIMSDKDDKTWDRSKYIMENLDVFIRKLDAMEERLMPAIEDLQIIKRARKGSIAEYIDGPPGKKN